MSEEGESVEVTKSIVIRTITIRKRGGMLFATSEDEPPIFIATKTLEEMYTILPVALARTLQTKESES